MRDLFIRGGTVIVVVKKSNRSISHYRPTNNLRAMIKKTKRISFIILSISPNGWMVKGVIFPYPLLLRHSLAIVSSFRSSELNNTPNLGRLLLRLLRMNDVRKSSVESYYPRPQKPRLRHY